MSPQLRRSIGVVIVVLAATVFRIATCAPKDTLTRYVPPPEAGNAAPARREPPGVTPARPGSDTSYDAGRTDDGRR